MSVVLPTRNRAATLPRAIASVLAQDAGELELIVVDDASTDGSDEIIRSLPDPRLVKVRLDRPVGAAAARNRALANARGEVVAFQDSDDAWCAGHLNVLLAALSERASNLVAYGIVRRPPSEGETLIPGPADLVRAGDLTRVLTRYNVVNLPSSVVRRNAIAACGGFDETLPRFQDWDLFLSLSALGDFAFVDQVVTESGDAPSRITHGRDAERIALERILSKHAALFALEPEHEVGQRARLVRMLAEARMYRATLRQVARICVRPRPAATWVRRRLAGQPSPLNRDRAGAAR